MRAPLDKFASEKAGLGRDDIIMTYLKNLPFGTPLSQKLQAEVVYLYFCGEDCPLLYDADGEEWYVWDLRWHPVGSSLARVKPFLQKQLEPCLR